ncbi:MAG: DUF2336 domain-containing protein [Kiloniellales bacterium]|nr:DUF2336 domain-containing protein [Kiloniellales bacterium]
MTRAKDTAPLSYDETKRLIRDADARVRAAAAARPDLRPEALYYLAEDPSPEVRRRIAANERTPAQAARLLAEDRDEAVRRDLAAKVARLTRHLSEPDQRAVHQVVIETLELLARDQATKVRQILSETLRDVADAPYAVIQRLARDTEAVVACPVLEFSPLLTDQDLLEIIAESRASAPLCAISRRHALAPAVSDALVAVDDRDAVVSLLANDSAQIREETLDGLVERSREVTAWQAPLAHRPRLPGGAVVKLAGFVANHLLDALQARRDLDAATASRVAEAVHRRLAEAPPADAAEPVSAAALLAAGRLDEDCLREALAQGDRVLVRESLALLGGADRAAVDGILRARSAKGVTALAWKAGLSMRFATQLQLQLGGIPPNELLHARGGVDFPLTPDEMTWQLEFFGVA